MTSSGGSNQYGLRKVIPTDEVLAEAYRRRYQPAYLEQHFGDLLERSREHIDGMEILPDLPEHVARRLQERPSLSWDDAVAEIGRPGEPTKSDPDYDGHGRERSSAAGARSGEQPLPCQAHIDLG